MIPDRIADKILVADCWHWQAAITNTGYGQVYWAGKTRLVHRMMYELIVGPVPAGLDLDHLCRNRSCVYPGHLEPVTRKENLARGAGNINKDKPLCIRGHEFNEENTYLRPSGGRTCKTCRLLKQREYHSN